MFKLHVLTAAIALAGSVAFAQTATTTEEKTEVKTSADGATRTKTSTKVSQTEYVDQLRTVYRSANIEQSKVERLVELDRKIYTAWIAGDEAAVRRHRIEQRQILEADELQKVHVYFQSNPLPTHWPEFVVNTWAPEASFNRDISISTTRTGAASGSINLGANQSSPSGATAAGTRSETKVETGGAATNPSTAGGSVSGKAKTDTNASGATSTNPNANATGAAGASGSSSAPNASGSMSGSTGATGSAGTNNNN